MVVVETRTDLIGQRARSLIALGRRFPTSSPAVEPADADLIDKLVYFTLRNRSVRPSAEAAFAQLRGRFPDWSRLSEVSLEEIEEAIRPAGLVHQRADLIQRLVIRISTDFPNGTYQEIYTWADLAILRYLVSLPGIGQFAADQVMLYVLGRPVLPVAWTFVRLLTRLGLVDQETTPGLVLDTAASLLAPTEHRTFYDILLEHARDVCVPRSPRCGDCPLTDACGYYKRVQLQRAFTRLSFRPGFGQSAQDFDQNSGPGGRRDRPAG